MPDNKLSKISAVATVLAAVMGVCLAAAALVPSFGQWLNIRAPLPVSGPTRGEPAPPELKTPVVAPSPTHTPQPTDTPEPPAGSTRVREKDGMVMVYIPAGEFLMGSLPGEGTEDEHPQRAVYISGGWLDRTEVTNAQYRRCVDVGSCSLPEYRKDENLAQDSQPVVRVDWQQAQTYCQWAGARLPSEAEWEKLARGTDGRRYPWGDAAAICDYAVLNDGSGNACGKGDAAWPVGSKPKGASPYGALDMAGNAWEWVADRYAPDYYARAPQRDPAGPASGTARVLRGGSWNNVDDAVRSANRTGDEPGLRSFNIGFRCTMPTMPAPSARNE
jgi:formylglycine-generating enzyme required for sulfatase activity